MKSLPFSGRSAFRFGLSLLVMAALTFGVARVVVPASQKTPQTNQGPGAAKAGDVPAGFVTVPGSNAPGTPLGPPPADQLIQLVSFDKDAPPPLFGERAPWWTPDGIPRVDHVTQFDGGRLQGVNCVMASGAMLARLGYGIVTTGSQMRSLLQPGHGGGTTFSELQQVLRSGWNVQFRVGAISPLMFRALLFAGAGAVVIVDYGSVPLNLRNQKNFDGNHAMYVDALRLRADGSGTEMYVMDPINRHHGDWWPAEVLERAAMDFGGGAIAAAWAFAGGIVPHGNYPPVPPAEMQPRGDQQPGQHKPTDPPIAASPAPSASAEPIVDEPIGDPAPPEPPPDPGDLGSQGTPTEDGYGIDFFLGLCVSANKPAFCPPGVPAVYPSAKAPPPTVPPLIAQGPLDLLYTDVPQPGVWRTIIGGPSNVEPTFSYWPANGSGPALEADAVLATLGGKQVWMVTVPIPQAGNFAFLASTINGGVVTATDVGAISFGN
jgi:hypothetical protein